MQQREVNNAKEIINIIQAFADGKKLQYYSKTNKKWLDYKSHHVPSINGNGKFIHNFRVKPDMIEFTVKVSCESNKVNEIKTYLNNNTENYQLIGELNLT